MKYMKKIRLSGFGYNVKRIVNNYIMLPIARIFSNIKYILTSDLVELDALDVVDDRLHYLEDKVFYSIKDRLSDVESTLEDKCNEYEVEDVIYNLMGSSEDYVSHDDMCDVKDDIKGIKNNISYLETKPLNDVKEDIKDINETIYELEKATSLLVKDMNTIVNEDLKVIENCIYDINNVDERIDTTLGVDEIKNVDSLLQEVNTLHSMFNQLTQDVEKLSKHSCNNLFSYSLKEWDLLVSDIIKSIISRVEYNENV